MTASALRMGSHSTMAGDAAASRTGAERPTARRTFGMEETSETACFFA